MWPSPRRLHQSGEVGSWRVYIGSIVAIRGIRTPQDERVCGHGFVCAWSDGAILAQAISSQDGHCFRVVRQVSFVFPVRRRKMPRRGWQDAEWSRQWLQLLMGPRPPSVQWPRSRQLTAKGHGKGRGPMTKGDGQSRHNPAQPPQRQPTPVVARPVSRSSPDEAVAATQGRVAAIEAAINALGDSDAVALKFLQEVLKKAKRDANCGPVGERLDGCTKFVERARKRLAAKRASKVRFRTSRGSCTSGRVAGRSSRGCPPPPDRSCRTAESCGGGSSHARCHR